MSEYKNTPVLKRGQQSFTRWCVNGGNVDPPQMWNCANVDLCSIEVSPCLDPGYCVQKAVRSKYNLSEETDAGLSKFMNKGLPLPLNTFAGIVTWQEEDLHSDDGNSTCFNSDWHENFLFRAARERDNFPQKAFECCPSVWGFISSCSFKNKPALVSSVVTVSQAVHGCHVWVLWLLLMPNLVCGETGTVIAVTTTAWS